MSEVAGKGGSVTFDGLTAGVKSWSLDGAADMLPTTDYGDNGHKTFIGGCDGWTASCELNWDAANTVKEGDSGELVLLVGAATPNYTGDVLVASISISSVVEGLVTATVSFQGTGAYTYTSGA